MSWLDDMTDALARTARLEASALRLSEETQAEILDLARIASHASGDRINAPLVCYALGLAVASGASLVDLARTVRQTAGEV